MEYVTRGTVLQQNGKCIFRVELPFWFNCIGIVWVLAVSVGSYMKRVSEKFFRPSPDDVEVKMRRGV